MELLNLHVISGLILFIDTICEIVEGKFPGIVIKMYFDDDGVMITETFFKGLNLSQEMTH